MDNQPDTVVEVRVNAGRFKWGDYKRFNLMQKRRESGQMTAEDNDWFIDFVDRVCVGNVDDVPMPDLMTLLWEGLNADMTARMNGRAAKN